MNSLKKLKKLHIDKFLIAVGVFAILFLGSMARYTYRSFDYPIWDEQHYMAIATDYYRLLQHPTASTISDMVAIAPFRQPGYSLLMLPFLLIFGISDSYFWGLFTNGILYGATLFAIYLIAKKYLSKLASFFATIVFLGYGWPLYFAHLTYSETATTTFTVWAVYFLITSNYFQKIKYSLLFGFFLGFAILTRWASIVFIVGPVLCILYQIFRKKIFLKKRVIIIIIASLLLAVAVPFYPYFTNFYWIADYFHGHRAGGAMWALLPDYERNPFSFYSLTFYLSTFEKLNIFYFLLLVAGTFIVLKKKSTDKLILSAIVIPWFFFSFFSILKDERFIVPVFPYLAITSAYVLDAIKKQKYKLLLFVAITLLSSASFLGSVWGKGPMKTSLGHITMPLPFNHSLPVHITSISRPPYIYKRSGSEIIDYIEKDSKKYGIKNPQVLSLFSHRGLDEPMMTYNLYQQDNPLLINNYLGMVLNPTEKETTAFMKNVLTDNDYVLVKTGQTTDTYFSKPNYVTIIALNKVFKNYFEKSKDYKKETTLWIFQDSSTVTIFKKLHNADEDEQKILATKLLEILKQPKKH